jgi:uncharacterized protein (DUF1499 family)
MWLIKPKTSVSTKPQKQNYQIAVLTYILTNNTSRKALLQNMQTEVPNTTPAAKFTQKKVQAHCIKDEIKYFYIKTTYLYNIM